MIYKPGNFRDKKEGGFIAFVAESILVTFLIFYSISRSVLNFFLPCKKYKDISNEIVLITGGGKGLGRVLAVEFAKFNPKHVGRLILQTFYSDYPVLFYFSDQLISALNLTLRAPDATIVSLSRLVEKVPS